MKVWRLLSVNLSFAFALAGLLTGLGSFQVPAHAAADALETEDPVAKVARPWGSTEDPVAKVARPWGSTADPVAKVTRPWGSTEDPVAKVARPWGSTAHAAADAIETEGESNAQFCDRDRADDVWLVSTRHLGCPGWDKTSAPDLHVEHYGGTGTGWIEASLDELLHHGDPTQPTMVYVHGNRVSWNEAIQSAEHARDSILGCSHMGPVRFVIWSWPSDKVHGQVRDVRIKAARTNGEAHYLASFLSQLDPTTPLSILGYSLGARVATGALHVLGGGELAGQTLPASPGPPARVALLAPALHNYWLQPGACHEQALSQMDRLLIQYNSCDPFLKHYKLIEKHARPAALGYTGMYADDSLGVWIEQRDVCCIVGKSHSEARYMVSASLTKQIRDTLFGE